MDWAEESGRCKEGWSPARGSAYSYQVCQSAGGSSSSQHTLWFNTHFPSKLTLMLVIHMDCNTNRDSVSHLHS